MDEPKPTSPLASTPATTTPQQPVAESTFARGSGRIGEVIPDRPERTEHSVTEGLPEWKADRIAAMRRELADLQRQLIESQQRIATELQGRADDAERYEALEARLAAQEQESRQKDAQKDARTAELTNEIASLTSKLASATATADKLSREAAESAKLQRELEDARKQHQAVTEQLESTKSERDARAGECEEARRSLDAASAKTREIANQLVRLGQGLLDGSGAAGASATVAVVPESNGAGSSAESKPVHAPPIPSRPQPPALPRQTPRADVLPVEAILDVTADARPAASRVGWALGMVAGVVLGCAATIVVMNRTDAGTTAAASAPERVDPPVPAPTATLPTAPTLEVETAPPAAAAAQPTPPAAEIPTTAGSLNAAPEPPTEQTAPTEPTEPAASTTGILVLPPEAAGHRVFVDGRSVEVKSFRAEVPCGAREVKIGSRGTAQNLEIACGGTTEVPATTRKRRDPDK